MMKHLKIVTGLAIAFVLSMASFSVAQQDGSCVTEKCHATMGTQQFVHGPVGARICSVCHAAVPDKKHQFEFTAERDELCFGCHEDARDMMLRDHLHTPVEDGNCTGCHDPHGTDYRFSLKGNAADLCFQCHKKAEFEMEFVHGPVGVGDCNVCHDPHAADHEKQLRENPEELCFTCHKEQVDMMTKRHIHPPVEEGCTSCHNPHSNNSRFLLGAEPPQLCYGCHSDIESYASLEFQHDPVASGDCQKCHDVHASENPRMFPKPQMELCLSCHTEMSEYVGSQKYKHGPVKEGDCNACHDPHGSENHRILRHFFPDEFYMPYATENYAICFQCHNKSIALDAQTSTLTDFRNGDVNMHYLHVNKDVKGRSCKACHEPHASNQQKHIRESVPFGKMNWNLPVTFTKSEDGGSCIVGCHAPKEYKR